MSTFILSEISEGKTSYTATVTETATAQKKNYIIEEYLWKWGRIKTDTELTEQDISDMAKFSLITQCLAHMRKILNYPHSRAELIEKLKQKSEAYTDEITEAVADYAEKHDLVNDRRQATHLTDIFLHRKCYCYGKKRIMEELLKRKYSPELAKEVTDAVPDSEYVRMLSWLLHQEYTAIPTDDKEKMRMVSSARHLGFSVDDLRAVLKNF